MLSRQILIIFGSKKIKKSRSEFSWKPFWGLGCATTDRIFSVVKYIHGAAADRTGSFWGASWWSCHTAKRLPRQIESFGIFLENGRIILENGLWSKICFYRFFTMDTKITKMMLFFVGTLSPFCKNQKTELHDFTTSEFSWKAVQWEVTIERSDIFFLESFN